MNSGQNGIASQITGVFFLMIPVWVSIALVGLFGGAFSKMYPEISYLEGFWLMNLICGSGWIIFMLVIFIFMDNEIFTDYLSYLIPVVLFSGLAVLIPYVIWDLAGGKPLPVFAWGTVLLSILLMLYRNYRKIVFLKLSLKWWFIWLICLLVPAALAVYFIFSIKSAG